MKRSDVFCAVALAFLVSPFYVHGEPLAENQARFGQVTGDVQLLASGVPQWVDAHEGLPLEPGDQIHVDDVGYAELAISQHAAWFLMPNTDVIIGHTTTDEGLVTLSSGALIGEADPVNGLSQGWRFEAPTADVVIRGTEFILFYPNSVTGTYLGVMKGLIELQPAETATQTFPAVAVNAKEEYLVAKGGKMKKSAVGPALQPYLLQLPLVRKRFLILGDTWSPYTESVRLEIRKKFVPPAQKMRPYRPPVAHRKADS